jgi:hypothetical protein
MAVAASMCWASGFRRSLRSCWSRTGAPPPDAWAKDGKTRLLDLHDAAYRRAVDRLILAGKTVLVAAAPDCTHAGRSPCKDADAFLTAHGSIRLRDLLERAKVAKLSDVGWRKKLADMSPEEYARGRKAFAAELGFDRVADVDAMRSCGRAGDSDKGAEKRARLIAIACEQELFQDDGDDGYAAIKRDGGAILTLKIEASGFRDWLLAEYGGRFPDNVAGRKVPGSVGESTVSDAIRTILALARQGEIREVFLRLGWRANRLYLDMATAEPRAIEITADGWAIVADPPVNLVRSPTAKPLPVPSPAPRKHVLKELRRFFGFKLKDDRLVLLIGVLMAGLMPRGPYPILIISGEQGSGKTSRSRMVKETLDPTKASVRGRPRTEIDLAISVWRSWIGVFDNLSRLDQNLSDALCRLSEGAGLSKRKFYTDSEEVVIEAARPIILTAIPDIAQSGDAIDRAVLIKCDQLPTKIREQVMRDQFEAFRPALLAYLIEAAACALRRYGAMVETHDGLRRGDWCAWVEAAAPALGLREGAFAEAYRRNQDQAVRMGLELDPAGAAILDYMAARHVVETRMTDLHAELEAAVRRQHSGRLPMEWPSMVHHFSGRLRRLAPMLRRVGIEFEQDLDPAARRSMVSLMNAHNAPRSDLKNSGFGGFGNGAAEPNPEFAAEPGSKASKAQKADPSTPDRGARATSGEDEPADNGADGVQDPPPKRSRIRRGRRPAP